MRRGRGRGVVAVLLLAGCPGTRAASAPPCPTDRTIRLGDQREVEALAGCTSVSGLTIRTGAQLDLSPLRALETIAGDLVVGPTLALEEVVLLELREVGGAIQVHSNSGLRGLLLPRLELAGRIEVEANAGLATVSLPRLATVRGALILTGNGSLELLDLSALVTVGKDLVITDHPKLSLIEAGKLEHALGVRIERNRALPPDQIDGLRPRTPPE